VAGLTRKELKSDKFALEVQHSVAYVSEHRQQLIRWGGISVAVAILAIAFFVYRSHERVVRQEALHEAMRIQAAAIGQQASQYVVTFPTEEDRIKATVKAFTDVAAKYPGTEEGALAEYFLGTNAGDVGKYSEAEQHFKKVLDYGHADFSSMAKLQLAKVYASEGKLGEGEKLLQSVIDHPSMLVSKDQASLAMGELIGKSDPARACKFILPLRSSPRAPVSKTAINDASDIACK
jgi:predicted negative regulator of RcsB-dependent stress response